MAGLMDSAHKDFSALAKKYNNFLTPAMKIKINNKDIKDTLKVGIVNVNVTLELDAASSATFHIVNVYELKNSKFVDDVKSTVKLGAIITVELGYDSELTEVFHGYIANLSMEFGGMPSISVTALNVINLMRSNVRKIQYEEKKFSEVAKKILDTYKAVCPKVVIDPPAGEAEEEHIMQIESDYSFIKNVLGSNGNCEFLVVGDTAYYREARKNKDPITTLIWGSGLISFSYSNNYCNEKIIVYGHDEKTNKAVKSETTAESDKDVKSVITPIPVRELYIANAEDEKRAKNIAEFELYELMKSKQTGNGSCIGLPELIPGRYLKIDKLDSTVNKKYYLKKVTHSFGTDGFTTDFDIGSW